VQRSKHSHDFTPLPVDPFSAVNNLPSFWFTKRVLCPRCCALRASFRSIFIMHECAYFAVIVYVRLCTKLLNYNAR
jgi:hypothetical protein